MSPYNLRNTNDSMSGSDSDSSIGNEAMKANFTESVSDISRALLALKKDLDLKNYSKINRGLEDLEDYYERALQVRIMHIKTITEDAATAESDATTKITALTTRVGNTRAAALRRKFQARMWMGAAGLSQIEIYNPRFTRTLVCDWIFPTAMEVITGVSRQAVAIRVVMATILIGQLMARMNLADRLHKTWSLMF